MILRVICKYPKVSIIRKLLELESRTVERKENKNRTYLNFWTFRGEFFFYLLKFFILIVCLTFYFTCKADTTLLRAHK